MSYFSRKEHSARLRAVTSILRRAAYDMQGDIDTHRGEAAVAEYTLSTPKFVIDEFINAGYGKELFWTRALDGALREIKWNTIQERLYQLFDESDPGTSKGDPIPLDLILKPEPGKDWNAYSFTHAFSHLGPQADQAYQAAGLEARNQILRYVSPKGQDILPLNKSLLERKFGLAKTDLIDYSVKTALPGVTAEMIYTGVERPDIHLFVAHTRP